jgi:hypothetical protein
VFEETCSSKSTSVIRGSAALPDCSKDNLYPFVDIYSLNDASVL